MQDLFVFLDLSCETRVVLDRDLIHRAGCCQACSLANYVVSRVLIEVLVESKTDVVSALGPGTLEGINWEISAVVGRLAVKSEILDLDIRRVVDRQLILAHVGWKLHTVRSSIEHLCCRVASCGVCIQRDRSEVGAVKLLVDLIGVGHAVLESHFTDFFRSIGA